MMELNSKVPSGPIQQAWERRKFELKLINPANKRKYTVIVVGSGLAPAWMLRVAKPGSATVDAPL